MPLDLSRIRALCFDIDGTLSDTDDQWTAQFERLFTPLRFAIPRRELRPFARRVVMALESPGNFVYHVLDRMNLDDEAAWLLQAMRRLHAPHSSARAFLLIPRVDAALRALAKRYPLAVVSARGAGGAHAFLNQFDLLPLFTTVVTAQTCRYTKPYPDPVFAAAEKMGVPAHECLMIGDTVVDIRAGKAAGAQTVGVLCGFGYESELRRAGADLILPSPYELLEMLTPEEVDASKGA